ncbi:hypothetical protein COCNU_15G000280 [Cocos nucifera]|uniref:Uncharacterized protein n=1 Tax=Cocos nucifera TaxID=13894 RepID=A0A8K0IXW2_COCNU|nr:hypothetical protein COCNU_15G000280 [Cocos nucifera]
MPLSLAAGVNGSGGRALSPAAGVKKNYAQRSQEKYYDDPSSQPMVDGQLWLNATGGSKKKKIIRFGNSLNKKVVLSSCASLSFVPSSRPSTQESNSDCTSCGAF